MGILNLFFKPVKKTEYSENVKGKWTDSVWSDKRHIEITDIYFPQMHKIEENWSIMYNLKDFSGKRADNFIQSCIQNISLYKEMSSLERKYGSTPPPNAPAFKRLAMIYEKQGRYEESISVCIDALLSGAYGDGMKSRLVRMIKKAKRDPTEEELLLINKE